MIGTPWDDSGGGGVLSVNGQTGEVTLTPGDIGADTQGAGIAAVADHMDESDPHPQYQLRSEAGVASGYAQLNPDALVLQDPASASAEPGPNLIAKTDSAGTLDAWISAASTTSPGLAQFAADAEVASNKAVAANDTWLSNARPPTAHATSHQHGGSDETGTATAAANGIPKATSAGKLDSGWGGGVNSLATLDSSTLVPTAQQGTGSADSTKFLRGDRTWATAVQGSLGATDNALLRADGTGGQTAQGSTATLDDTANLRLSNRSFNQPIAPSAWSGASSTHDQPIPSWATAAGKYFALIRVRVQQNSTTSNYSSRTHHVELTYNGSVWSLDGSMADPSLGGLATTFGWSISGGTNLRFSLSGMGGGNAGNVGMVLEQFVFYGAL